MTHPVEPLMAPNLNRHQNLLGYTGGTDTQVAQTFKILTQLRHCWDKNGETWTQAIRQGLDPFRRYFLDDAFLKFLGPVKQLQVLDAGCGEGSLCRKLAEQGAQVTGIDLSGKLIDAAQKQEAASPHGIQYHVDSFTDLSTVPSKHFDRVVSHMALMDSPHLDNTFEAFNRVLKNNGQVIFSVKHPFITQRDINTKLVGPDRIQMSYTGSYFDPTPFEKTVGFNPQLEGGKPLRIQSIHYPHTLSTYINELHKAGFRNIAVCEPSPGDDACKLSPDLGRYQKIPAILMISADKSIPHMGLAASFATVAHASLLDKAFVGLSILGIGMLAWHIGANTHRTYQQSRSKGDTPTVITAVTSLTFIEQVLKAAACLKLASYGAYVGGLLASFGFCPILLGSILAGSLFSVVGYRLLSLIIPDPLTSPHNLASAKN
jgi:SAM-dependent methyltransferase